MFFIRSQWDFGRTKVVIRLYFQHKSDEKLHKDIFFVQKNRIELVYAVTQTQTQIEVEGLFGATADRLVVRKKIGGSRFQINIEAFV